MDKRSPIYIRTATKEDAPHITDIGRDVFSRTFGHSLEKQDLEDYLNSEYTIEKIEEVISSPLCQSYVAVDGTEVVGFGKLRKESYEDCIKNLNKPIELWRLYVSISQHGRGIGAQLIDHLENLARNQGYENIWLGVWEENYVAQKVYKRHGYVECGVHPFTMGQCVQNDLILMKKL
ncbi:acyl-CoA N-acyltransferase [Acrasis kona]|uniref:Acyl-CoA N-acyltransferase n=1 Tax=Acrasis kona TaxID=1008807 RepID=A0AAW2ZD91_9EUKA